MLEVSALAGAHPRIAACRRQCPEGQALPPRLGRISFRLRTGVVEVPRRTHHQNLPAYRSFLIYQPKKRQISAVPYRGVARRRGGGETRRRRGAAAERRGGGEAWWRWDAAVV
jgi:hypothetical protein